MSDQHPSPSSGQPTPTERPQPAAGAANPFLAPSAHVDDVRHSRDGSLLGEPNRVAAGRGAGWWNDGWDLFREAIGVWIGMTIAFLAISVLLSLIPFLGLVLYLLFPAFAGGLMLGCRSLDSGRGLTFSHLFAGFQKNFGQQALAGVLYLVGIAIVVLAIFVIFGGGIAALMMGSGEPPSAGTAITFLLAMLVAMGLSIPLAMAIWFAPALIALNDLGALDAMQLSFRGCVRNMLPFLAYGLIGVVLAIVATIPLGLGWLVLMPTIAGATYASYRDIFVTADQ